MSFSLKYGSQAGSWWFLAPLCLLGRGASVCSTYGFINPDYFQIIHQIFNLSSATSEKAFNAAVKPSDPEVGV